MANAETPPTKGINNTKSKTKLLAYNQPVLSSLNNHVPQKGNK